MASAFSVSRLPNQETVEVSFDLQALRERGILHASISHVHRHLADPELGLWEQTETEYVSYEAEQLPEKLSFPLPQGTPGQDEYLVKLSLSFRLQADGEEPYREAHYVYLLTPQQGEG